MGSETLLRGIEEGRIRCLAVDTPVPSQFSHEILNANPYAYLDDAPLEERRARAVEMRRILPESVLEEVGKLDPAAIAQVREEAWPDVRDADELHDVLHTLIAFPETTSEQPSPAVQWSEARQVSRNILSLTSHFDSSPDSRAALDRTTEGGRPHASNEWQRHFERLIEQGAPPGPSIRACVTGSQQSGPKHFLCYSPTHGLIVRYLNFTRLFPLPTMRCWLWSPDGCRIWARPPLRSLGTCLAFLLLRSRKHSFAWKPRAPCCEESSPKPHRGRVARAHMSHSSYSRMYLNWNGVSGGCWRAFTG